MLNKKNWDILVALVSELSYAQREDRSPSQATVTVTNLRLTVSVDIKKTGVRNIPGRTEQGQLDGNLSAATPWKGGTAGANAPIAYDLLIKKQWSA